MLFNACPRISRATFYAECRVCQHGNRTKKYLHVPHPSSAALGHKFAQSWARAELHIHWLYDWGNALKVSLISAESPPSKPAATWSASCASSSWQQSHAAEFFPNRPSHRWPSTRLNATTDLKRGVQRVGPPKMRCTERSQRSTLERHEHCSWRPCPAVGLSDSNVAVYLWKAHEVASRQIASLNTLTPVRPELHTPVSVRERLLHLTV